MAVAIDGEICQDAYAAELNPDSEISLIPKSAAAEPTSICAPEFGRAIGHKRQKNNQRLRVDLIFASFVLSVAPWVLPNS